MFLTFGVAPAAEVKIVGILTIILESNYESLTGKLLTSWNVTRWVAVIWINGMLPEKEAAVSDIYPDVKTAASILPVPETIGLVRVYSSVSL